MAKRKAITDKQRLDWLEEAEAGHLEFVPSKGWKTWVRDQFTWHYGDTPRLAIDAAIRAMRVNGKGRK